MASTSHSQPTNNAHIFVDTCIIQYLGKKNNSLGTVVNDCLLSLEEKGFILTISEITFYEHISGLWGSRSSKADTLLRTYEYKQLTREVLLVAAMFSGLYHDEQFDGISSGDMFIAATAFLESGFILTSNHKDFPHPFFITEKSFPLPYQVGHYTKTLDVVLYKPNFELISRRIREKRLQEA